MLRSFASEKYKNSRGLSARYSDFILTFFKNGFLSKLLPGSVIVIDNAFPTEKRRTLYVMHKERNTELLLYYRKLNKMNHSMCDIFSCIPQSFLTTENGSLDNLTPLSPHPKEKRKKLI